MRTLYRPLLCSLLVGTSLLATSCGDKKTDPVAQPQASTATLSGQVTPAGSILSVTATDASGKASVATPNSSTGAYSFPSLAPGTYTLVFAPASGYVAPATASVTLVAGGTTVPTVTVAPVPTTATLSGQINPAGAVA
ncbi:MAG: carboxypeptidase regulatory-like domain-containing protein, partial [Hymenobacter sp.]